MCIYNVHIHCSTSNYNNGYLARNCAGDSWLYNDDDDNDDNEEDDDNDKGEEIFQYIVRVIVLFSLVPSWMATTASFGTNRL